MDRTALVICAIKYFDIELNREIFKKEKINVTLERAKILIDKKVCELVNIKQNGIRKK